jgi:hypothetical protein
LHNKTLVLLPGVGPFVLVRNYECKVDRVRQILFRLGKHEFDAIPAR